MILEWLFNSRFPARAFQTNNSEKSGGHVHRSHGAVTPVTSLALAPRREPRSAGIIAAFQDYHE
jgi:hypothetical protein